MMSKKYKIVRYKGKTKLKDTKTGKTAEIDIEKFMNGGYKTTYDSYMDGGVKEKRKFVPQYGCGGLEGQALEICQEKERKMHEADGTIDYSAFTNLNGVSQQGMITETNYNLPTDEENEMTELDMAIEEQEAFGKDKKLNREYRRGTRNQEKNAISHTLYKEGYFDDDDEEKNNFVDVEEGYNINNPYGGVDMTAAANHLGTSIENKNALGAIASTLKIATNLGREVVTGIGNQRKYDREMKNYYENQKKSRNPIQYQEDGGYLESFSYGGKKEEELHTGEYMRGEEDPNASHINAEVEQGEYFQTNEGDVSEVVGDKHSQGGERIAMEAEDRVLSDKLTLGDKTAKMLASKYDLKVKSKNTYSDVLDKFRKKVKLDKLVEEEAMYLKKMGDQDKTEDQTTKELNVQALAAKIQDVRDRKHPMEEMRKDIFEELFQIQESTKPKSKKKNQENLAHGGMIESLANEYGVTTERAKQLVEEFSKGGEKDVPKYDCGGEKIGSEAHKKCMEEQGLTLKSETAEAKKDVRKGQHRNEKDGSYGDVTQESYEDSLRRNAWYFDRHPDFDSTNRDDVMDYQRRYNEIAKRLGKSLVEVDGYWGEQTDSIDVNREYDTRNDTSKTKEVSYNDYSHQMQPYLFPDETPLPPSALQGTIKPEHRYDRVRPTEISVDPYLQDIRDREQSQIQSLEGLSPNVRAAVMANMRANSQKAESEIRNNIDNRNLQSQEKAIYTNAQIQQREENASEQNRLAYEARQYRAQALTDNDYNEYHNKLQELNKQKYLDIHNMNLINNSQDDMYFDGRTYRRKKGSSDKELWEKFMKFRENERETKE